MIPAYKRKAAPPPSLNLVEVSIDAIIRAPGASLELAASSLARIQHYDHRTSEQLPPLKAVRFINPHALDEALASDLRKACKEPARLLEGVPFLVDHAFKVKGSAVTSAFPALKNLVANEDAFVVEKLCEAGAVLIGKTDALSKMHGGLDRGLYGCHPEPPLDAENVAATSASASSSGCAVATAASFASFGIGSDATSAARNGLAAYTPSWGFICTRGLWPLHPATDAVVPHARSMADMLRVLQVLVQPGPRTDGDYWRGQSVVPVPEISQLLPPGGLLQVAQGPAVLNGKRFGVSSLFIREKSVSDSSVDADQEVIDMFRQAKQDLEAAGAQIIETEMPNLTEYIHRADSKDMTCVEGLPREWQDTEQSDLVTYAMDDFLRANRQDGCSSLAEVDAPATSPSEGTGQPQNLEFFRDTLHYDKMIQSAKSRGQKSMYDLPGTEEALKAFETFRKTHFEAHLEANGFDALIFPPAACDARADADEHNSKDENADHSLRRLGIPSVSVTLGLHSSTQLPVGLTFTGKAFSDINLLSYAAAFEALKPRRQPPSTAPGIPSDTVILPKQASPVALAITLEDIRKVPPPSGEADSQYLMMKGVQHLSGASKYTSFWSDAPRLSVYVDGEDHSKDVRYWEDGEFEVRTLCKVPPTIPRGESAERDRVAAEETSVVIVARKNGFLSGGIIAFHP